VSLPIPTRRTSIGERMHRFFLPQPAGHPSARAGRAHARDPGPSRGGRRTPRVGAAAAIVVAAVSAAFTFGCGGDTESPPIADAVRARPNVVVIVMDTTRADRCSVHGYERATTPALDALGREGVVFDSAWAPSSWTLPTHASIFTGLLPQRHGATTDGTSALARRHETLAEILRDAGYATGAFSNNPFVSEEFGLTQGFSTFRSLNRERNLPYPSAIPTNEHALRWVREQRRAERPFFLFVNHMEPHSPYAPPATDADAFVRGAVDDAEMEWGRAFDFPANLLTMLDVAPISAGQLRLVSDLYDAEIATLDRAIGDFVERLRAEGVLDDTVLVVTGDHGEHFGENGLLGHCLSLARPLLEVPLVIRYPGVFEGGLRVDDVVRSEDLFPTILELCDVVPPAGIDGESLLRDLPGRVALGYLGRPRGIIEAAQRVAPQVDMSVYDVTLRSAFDGRHLLVVRGSDGHEQLFDVEADPGCEVDVAADEPRMVARLRAEMSPASQPAATPTEPDTEPR